MKSDMGNRCACTSHTPKAKLHLNYVPLFDSKFGFNAIISGDLDTIKGFEVASILHE